MEKAKNNLKIEHGDFQTPLYLAEHVLELLGKLDVEPQVILEPNCGKGAFVVAACKAFPSAKVLGFDINESYLDECYETVSFHAYSNEIQIESADFFSKDWEALLNTIQGDLLILGNPPWITQAQLTVVDGANKPTKSNATGLKGLDALTGKSNFDISEWMLLRYVEWIKNRKGSVSVLVKEKVARKVIIQLWKSNVSYSMLHMYTIDAHEAFDVHVDAVLLLICFDPDNNENIYCCKCFSSMKEIQPEYVLGWNAPFLVADQRKFEKWKHLLNSGKPAFQWRSGIKHDCASVFELTSKAGVYYNPLGERVDVEIDSLFPFMKSSSVANKRLNEERFLLVTSLNLATVPESYLQEYPKALAYLNQNRSKLLNRASKIYVNRPAFAQFGIGTYTFKPWKIAVSGLYKSVAFQLIGPREGKPVVFDDTVYFISFDTQGEADFMYKLVQSETFQELLHSMIFLKDKRPVTVDLLSRINLKALAAELNAIQTYQRLFEAHSALLFT